jgi:threonine/homoserine/homoserine lactone efflux protein
MLAHLPDALIAGLLAGYAIAIPVGPIAVLIFETGLRRGLRVGLAAGAGAASADGFYATLAGLVGGALATAIAPILLPARIFGAALLAFIAVRLLLGAVAVAQHRRSLTDERAAEEAEAEAGRARPGSPLRTYLLFLGLTVVNPATFLYFGALMLGLPVATSAEGRALFVVGAFGASMSWQWLLAIAGSLLHGRLPDRIQAVTRAFGSLMVLAFAARLLLSA